MNIKTKAYLLIGYKVKSMSESWITGRIGSIHSGRTNNGYFRLSNSMVWTNMLFMSEWRRGMFIVQEVLNTSFNHVRMSVCWRFKISGFICENIGKYVREDCNYV